MWSEACQNPEALRHLYADVPDVNPVEIHEVVIRRDGPLLEVRVQLPTFPDHPPARWPEGANTVQVTIDLWGVSDFEQQGWGTENRGTLALKRLDSGELLFSFESESARLRAKCTLARISRVSAYVNDAAV